MDRVNDGYRQLCAAVLNKAISDRKEAMMKLKKNPDDEKGKELLKDCDAFFKEQTCELMLDYLDIDKEAFMEVVYGC